jgi:hypothetical protein
MDRFRHFRQQGHLANIDADYLLKPPLDLRHSQQTHGTHDDKQHNDYAKPDSQARSYPGIHQSHFLFPFFLNNSADVTEP